MVANCDRSFPISRRMMATASALALGVSLSAAAQTAPVSKISADAQSYSSSTNYAASLRTDALLGAPPAPLGTASPQYGGHNNYPSYNNYSGTWSHIAFDAGAGFTAPIGNDTSWSQAALNDGDLSPSEGWGYNINVGGGWNFTKKFGALLEYQFNRENIAGDYLNALNAANGSSSSSGGLGGNINTWSLTLDPVFYLPYNQASGFFVTGGGGFYRKVTNFTEPVCGQSFYYYYCQNATAYHFSSNQGGLNGGLGWYHKVFGPDSNGKFYAEVRYVWVDSPRADSSNYLQGEGTEGLIPVTFGVRF